MHSSSVRTPRELRDEKEAVAAPNMREAKSELEAAFWAWTHNRLGSSETAEKMRTVSKKLVLAAERLDEVEGIR